MKSIKPYNQELSNSDRIIDYGVLLDVSHLSKAAGLEYRSFISPALWNCFEISRKEDLVQKLFWMERVTLRRRIQTRDGGRYVANLYLAMFTSVAYHIMPSRRFGVVLVVTEPEENLEPRASRTRAGGSFYNQ